jgi:REP element-mobilizing transposase RayT
MEHCALFLACVEEMVGRYGLEIHAYSLMPNHYHLIVRSLLGNLSRSMRHLNSVYTQRLNLSHGWDGPLFRGRFRSQLVEDERHLKYLFAYVHLNPFRAGLARRLDDDSWTSLRTYLGREQCPRWLSVDFFSQLLGGTTGCRRLVESLRKKNEAWPEGLDLETGWLRKNGEREEFPTSRFAPRSEPDPVEEALRRICAIARCELRDVRQRQMGPRANPARRFAAWALSRSGGRSEREIGRALGMSSNQVAKVLQRLRKQAAPEPLRGWMRELSSVS